MLCHFKADASSGEVVARGVNATPNAGQAALVGRVPVGGPLQDDVLGRPFFKDEEFVGGGREFAHASREEGVAGDGGEDFRRGA